ncbi:cell wall-active antibiotics response protein LiaF [Paenibacillus oceani]|uniref:Cell wall-active antibiotics response protein n=1 Tax=Paenibacillus oceani TaxID=2772510 RepID=A0A927CE23_9BACL|nr:cell wall-active antibiotics response protein LiaF [Paenibacillus oceani]MBD2865764.1 cell wall-active antibiotics response protein [Paenibacillus oceani]
MRSDFWSKAIGGFVLIGIGVLFLLNQIDIIDMDLGYIISHFWPLVLIFIGLSGILSQRSLHRGGGGGFVWGLFMIALGLVFLNNNFGWIPGFGISDLIKFAIPVILILVGLRILFRRREPQQEPPYTPKDWQPYSSSLDQQDAPDPRMNEPREHADPSFAPPPPPPPPAWSDDRDERRRARRDWRQQKREWKHEWKDEWKENFGHHDYGCSGKGVDNRHNFIGDIHIGSDYWQLKPLNISHFVGDTVIDLTRADIPFGDTTINISAFVGDVKVFVPNDVQVGVSVRISAFIGDMSVFNRREGGLFRNMNEETVQYRDAEKRIRINVSTFVGDVRVKRVG